VRRRPAAVSALLVALLASGCGRERIEAPDVARPVTPEPAVEQRYPAAGIIFERPANWPFDPGEAPLVASTSSGDATIALWRYPRSEPLPDDTESLADAQEQLEAAVRNRDPTFELERSRRLEVDGARAVQVLGTGSVAGQRRRLRSTHVYAKEAEYVIDAYAADDDFAQVDEAVFRPLVESFKIDPPQP
jgi:hypothetical protein